MTTTPDKPATTRRAEPAAASPALVGELAAIVGRDRVLTALPDRLAYQADCWPRGIIRTRGRDLDHHMPRAIVQPSTTDEVARIIGWARQHSTPVVPYGAGSGVCGGAIAQAPAIIVDVKRMARIVRTRGDDLTVRVEAGAIGMPFERELQRQGYTLGHFPSSILCSSVGGWLAARSAGQFSSRYGKIEDMVASMQVVTGTGEVIETAADPLAEVPAAAAGRSAGPLGPDLTQIFVGSEGTLGVITAATLLMDRKPPRQVYRGFTFPDIQTALAGMADLMQAGLKPTCVRLYDAFDTLLHRQGGADEDTDVPPGLLARLRDLADTSLPDGVTSRVREQIRRVSHGIVGRVLGAPLTLNRLIDVLPQECLLIVGFEGFGPVIDDEAQYAFELLSRYGLDMGSEPGLHWLEHRYDVSYKQSPMYDTGAFVDTMEVSTTWSNAINLYDTVRRALSPHVLVMAHFSHIYPEGTSIYFTFAGFGDDLQTTLDLYDRTWKAGLDAVAQTGSNIAHHHGVGQSKAAWTHCDHRGGRRLFDALKAVFDPDGIMNPGKVYR